jgi:hypothetical protein
MIRNAYLLTCNPTSERCIFSKTILENVGFNVIIFNAIPDKKPLLSHKISMEKIYEIIINDITSEWSYIFEDDINVLENIKLEEIIKYESISTNVFYLGICKYHNNMLETEHIINGHKVFKVSNYVRGLHAVAFSRKGMQEFLNFMNYHSLEYIDMILELYTIKNPANVVRGDLESYISGHFGVFFQDRNKFPSTI